MDIRHGRNFDLRLDDFVKCERCGFQCKLSRDNRATRGSRAGWGLTYERIYTQVTIVSQPTLEDTMVSARARITTEDGIAIFTEDGDTLVTEE